MIDHPKVQHHEVPDWYRIQRLEVKVLGLQRELENARKDWRRAIYGATKAFWKRVLEKWKGPEHA